MGGHREFVRVDLEAWTNLGAWAKLDGNWPVHYILYHLAKLMYASETVEIGIGRGHGTYLLGLHAKQVGGRHTAIDVVPSVCNRAAIVRDTFDLPVDVLCADSKAVFWQKRIDLCYVDGGHSTGQVFGDIGIYARWVRRNGLLVFDDYGKKHLGVTQAVDQAHDSAQWEMSVWPWCWWAIWRRL